jgi:large subunit ribosomal protein L25
VTDKAIHIDFLRIDASSVVTVSVPFDFANPEASPGIKRGGVLNIVHHEIELRCRPDQIPAHITIDLTGLEVGSSIHLKDVTIPEGVTPISHDQDYTIATVASPSAMRGKEEEADAAPVGAEAAKPPAPEAAT